MPPNRIVALFAPFVALAAGVTATWLTEHVSGLEVSAGQLEAVFIAALTAVLAPAAQWMHGSQKLARIEAELERAALDADTRTLALAGAGARPGRRRLRRVRGGSRGGRGRRRLRGRARRGRADPGGRLRCRPPRPRR